MKRKKLIEKVLRIHSRGLYGKNKIYTVMEIDTTEACIASWECWRTRRYTKNTDGFTHDGYALCIEHMHLATALILAGA